MAIVGALVLATACDDDPENPNGPAPDYTLGIDVPASLTIGQDSTVNLGATVVDTESETTVSSAALGYTSSDPAVAVVSSTGAVTARGPGQANITVTFANANTGEPIEATVPVTVTAYPLASMAFELPANASSPANTIFIAEARRVRGLILSAAGDTLYCSTGGGGNCSANVLRPNAEGGVDTLPRVNRFLTFTIPGVDTTIATVSNTGLVTVKDVDPATVPATFDVVITSPGDELGGVAGSSTTVTVNTALRPVVEVAVEPNDEAATGSTRPGAVTVEGTLEMTATPYGQDGVPIADSREAVVTWESSDPSIATVDERGVVTGVAPGTVTITARIPDLPGSAALISGSTQVIVQE